MALSLKETNRTLNGDLATVIVYPATLTKIPQTGWLLPSNLLDWIPDIVNFTLLSTGYFCIFELCLEHNLILSFVSL